MINTIYLIHWATFFEGRKKHEVYKVFRTHGVAVLL